jgi:hypothetical protein
MEPLAPKRSIYGSQYKTPSIDNVVREVDNNYDRESIEKPREDIETENLAIAAIRKRPTIETAARRTKAVVLAVFAIWAILSHTSISLRNLFPY